MWKRNFMFRSAEATPLKESENELFHDTDPAMDSAGLQLEKFLSVWIQGDGEDEAPTAFTNMYVRTATLDFAKRVGFLQPLKAVHTRSNSCSRRAKSSFSKAGSPPQRLRPGKPRTSILRCCSSSTDIL